MLEPRQPIHVRRQDRFRPPHCPWPECHEHLATTGTFEFKREGFYLRKRSPRRIRRYRCRSCNRTFSRDAFSTTYYLKRPELLIPIATWLVSGSAHRQIARAIGCAPSTVTRLSVRIGRHSELFHRRAIGELHLLDEPVVLDHFETFVRSQTARLGIGTAVGQSSLFVYALSGAAYLRVRGRSRKKRALKQRPRDTPRGDIARSTRRILRTLLALAPGGLDLVTDAHPAYRSAIRTLRQQDQSAAVSVRHVVHANPDRSPGHDRAIARRRNHAMFAVDALHKLLRHSQSHHRRETIAFGRRRSSVLGRTALFAVWRNMIKLVTERRPTRLTPAIRLGLTAVRWTWIDVFAERIFAARLQRS